VQDDRELDELYSAAYDQLRRLAGAVWGGAPEATLNPTALVNEAYIKLSRSKRLDPQDLRHFKRIAARAMRQVLVQAARRKAATKRGAGAPFLTLDEEQAGTQARCAADVLAVHEAVERLSLLNPRQAQVVECRFFGGCEVGETAEILGVSKSVVERDWRAARAWLSVELKDFH